MTNKLNLDKIVTQMRGDFFQRVPSLLKDLNYSISLLDLKNKNKKENMQELIRQVHSLKASLNLLQFSKEAKLAHDIEEELLLSLIHI